MKNVVNMNITIKIIICIQTYKTGFQELQLMFLIETSIYLTIHFMLFKTIKDNIAMPVINVHEIIYDWIDDKSLLYNNLCDM